MMRLTWLPPPPSPPTVPTTGVPSTRAPPTTSVGTLTVAGRWVLGVLVRLWVFAGHRVLIRQRVRRGGGGGEEEQQVNDGEGTGWLSSCQC